MIRTIFIAFTLVATLVGSSFGAGLISPLVIGVSEPIQDEFGELLDGNGAQPGDRVQILLADISVTLDGVIHPPSHDGSPHPDNPVLFETGIGSGTSPFLEQPGYFCLVLPRDQLNALEGTRLFVRVFNASDPTSATFYADSTEIFTVTGNTEFLAKINQTVLPIDETDSDGDGLADAVERVHLTDVTRKDTDGDGMSDALEVDQGTNPLAVLRIGGISRDGNTLVLQVTGVGSGRFVIEECPGENLQSGAFVPVTPVIETAAEHHVVRLPGRLAGPNQHCFYRVAQILN